jgi:hypothetical protein
MSFCRHLTEKKVRLINAYDRAIPASGNFEGPSGVARGGLLGTGTAGKGRK